MKIRRTPRHRIVRGLATAAAIIPLVALAACSGGQANNAPTAAG
jgi:hypothetical protein